MSAFGKKFLSAFIEIQDNNKADKTAVTKPASNSFYMEQKMSQTEANSKFAEHFNKLFSEANHQGPDYYEFSRMIEAMQSIPDEQARYSAAFAGLQVQGLDKQKLLSSAQEYIQLLETDAAAFSSTISDALNEKVSSKKEQIEMAKNDIQKLSQQILGLQEKIAAWTEEVTQNELKISSSNSSYSNALEGCRRKLSNDVEKINQYIL